MKTIIIADNQDITNAGVKYIFTQAEQCHLADATNKKELIEVLTKHPDALVVLDYTLFDIRSIDDLLILGTRFSAVRWLLFSAELSDGFIKQIYFNTENFSILYKDCSREELVIALHEIRKGHRYISNVISTALINNAYKQGKTEKSNLTTTEQQILKDIASGKTTKDIAAERHVSIHTVVSHRKNIFRKIGVNNIHEATKYAVKAGLVDLAEYFI